MPDAFKAANNPVMAAYYDKIGDQFNADMEPIIRNNFGDILRRDAVTDNNGVMVAPSTPRRLNISFSGVAGFVVSCDQFPNDDASTPAVGGPFTGSGINGASNFGEFFYLYQPVVNAAGYGDGTPYNRHRTVRSTFIHEKQVRRVPCGPRRQRCSRLRGRVVGGGDGPTRQGSSGPGSPSTT